MLTHTHYCTVPRTQEYPISELAEEPDSVRAILTSVAVGMARSLVDFSESISEPTDHGYLRGYQLELRGPTGETESRLVFIGRNLDRAAIEAGVRACS